MKRNFELKLLGTGISYMLGLQCRIGETEGSSSAIVRRIGKSDVVLEAKSLRPQKD